MPCMTEIEYDVIAVLLLLRLRNTECRQPATQDAARTFIARILVTIVASKTNPGMLYCRWNRYVLYEFTLCPP